MTKGKRDSTKKTKGKLPQQPGASSRKPGGYTDGKRKNISARAKATVMPSTSRKQTRPRTRSFTTTPKTKHKPKQFSKKYELNTDAEKQEETFSDDRSRGRKSCDQSVKKSGNNQDDDILILDQVDIDLTNSQSDFKTPVKRGRSCSEPIGNPSNFTKSKKVKACIQKRSKSVMEDERAYKKNTVKASGAFGEKTKDSCTKNKKGTKSESEASLGLPQEAIAGTIDAWFSSGKGLGRDVITRHKARELKIEDTYTVPTGDTELPDKRRRSFGKSIKVEEACQDEACQDATMGANESPAESETYTTTVFDNDSLSIQEHCVESDTLDMETPVDTIDLAGNHGFCITEKAVVFALDPNSTNQGITLSDDDKEISDTACASASNMFQKNTNATTSLSQPFCQAEKLLSTQHECAPSSENSKSCECVILDESQTKIMDQPISPKQRKRGRPLKTDTTRNSKTIMEKRSSHLASSRTLRKRNLEQSQEDTKDTDSQGEIPSQEEGSGSHIHSQNASTATSIDSIISNQASVVLRIPKWKFSDRENDSGKDVMSVVSETSTGSLHITDLPVSSHYSRGSGVGKKADLYHKKKRSLKYKRRLETLKYSKKSFLRIRLDAKHRKRIGRAPTRSPSHIVANLLSDLENPEIQKKCREEERRMLKLLRKSQKEKKKRYNGVLPIAIAMKKKKKKRKYLYSYQRRKMFPDNPDVAGKTSSTWALLQANYDKYKKKRTTRISEPVEADCHTESVIAIEKKKATEERITHKNPQAKERHTVEELPAEIGEEEKECCQNEDNDKDEVVVLDQKITKVKSSKQKSTLRSAGRLKKMESLGSVGFHRKKKQPLDLMLKDPFLSKHACVLWCSEQRRHFQQLHPLAFSDELDDIMREHWNQIEGRDKVRYYQRAWNAMNDHTMEKKSTVSSKKKKKNKVTLSDKAGVTIENFVDLPYFQQLAVLHEKLKAFQKFLSNIGYDRFLTDFKETFAKTLKNNTCKNEDDELSEDGMNGAARKILYSLMVKAEPQILKILQKKRWMVRKKLETKYRNIVSSIIHDKPNSEEFIAVGYEADSLSDVLQAIENIESVVGTNRDPYEKIKNEAKIQTIAHDLATGTLAGTMELEFGDGFEEIPNIMDEALARRILRKSVHQEELAVFSVHDVEDYFASSDTDVDIMDDTFWDCNKTDLQISMANAEFSLERSRKGYEPCCFLDSYSCILSDLIVIKKLNQEDRKKDEPEAQGNSNHNSNNIETQGVKEEVRPVPAPNNRKNATVVQKKKNTKTKEPVCKFTPPAPVQCVPSPTTSTSSQWKFVRPIPQKNILSHALTPPKQTRVTPILPKKDIKRFNCVKPSCLTIAKTNTQTLTTRSNISESSKTIYTDGKYTYVQNKPLVLNVAKPNATNQSITVISDANNVYPAGKSLLTTNYSTAAMPQGAISILQPESSPKTITQTHQQARQEQYTTDGYGGNNLYYHDGTVYSNSPSTHDSYYNNVWQQSQPERHQYFTTKKCLENTYYTEGLGHGVSDPISRWPSNHGFECDPNESSESIKSNSTDLLLQAIQTALGDDVDPSSVDPTSTSDVGNEIEKFLQTFEHTDE